MPAGDPRLEGEIVLAPTGSGSDCIAETPARAGRGASRALGVGQAVTSVPSRRILPPSAASSPAIKCSSVLLPLPDSPVSATRSPRGEVEIDAPQHMRRASPADEKVLEQVSDAQHDRWCPRRRTNECCVARLPRQMPGCVAAEAVASVRQRPNQKSCQKGIRGEHERSGNAQEMRPASTTHAATPKGAWTITFLLFLFMLVNFADKIVVGLAGVPIMTELKLEPGAVRPARLLLLLPVLDLGHRGRLHRQQGADALGAA